MVVKETPLNKGGALLNAKALLGGPGVYRENWKSDRPSHASYSPPSRTSQQESVVLVRGGCQAHGIRSSWALFCPEHPLDSLGLYPLSLRGIPFSFLKIYLFEREREREMGGRRRGRERVLSQLHTERRAPRRAPPHDLGVTPHRKPRVKRLTNCATQAPRGDSILIVLFIHFFSTGSMPQGLSI